MKDANLVMKQGLKLELVSHTDHKLSFIGSCKNVEIAIGGLKTKYSGYVVETGDHDFVLSQYLLNSVKFH